MRKYLYLLAGLTTITTLSSAESIDSSTALQRALKDAPKEIRSVNKSKWVMTDEVTFDGNAMVYLFTAQDKFMAVSADTKAPALLGYSETGVTFKDGEMAPGCRYWLDFMARRIASIPEKDERIRVIPKAERTEMEKLEPLVKTKWNQAVPYNNLCPKVKDNMTYTGCVATAMAQAMKYHNWPESGEGSNSYKWTTSILSADFTKYHFRWNDMLDSYDFKFDAFQGQYIPVNYTEAQGEAVAELMYAAGISVYMNYGTGGSGASSMNIAPALGDFFKYDRESLRFLHREYYGLAEWEEIIYKSLKEDGPVIYDGQSYQGGHSFICDGYDGNGYFHFNWGWGGTSDGYFLLDALDPYEQGIGGSASNSGFDFMQDVIVGIRPDREGRGGEMTGLLCATAPFEVDEEMEYSLGDTFTMGFPSNNFVYNIGPGTLPTEMIIGLKYESLETDGEDSYSLVKDDQEILLGYGFTSLPLTLDEEMKDGEYMATMVYGWDIEALQTVPVPLYDSPGYHVSVKDGKVRFSQISPVVLESLSIDFPDEVEKLEITGREKVFTATAQAENTSDKPVYTYISCLILNDVDYKCAEGFSAVVDFAPGETKEIIYSSPFTKTLSFKLKSGLFKYALCQETTTAYIPFAEKTIRIVDNLSSVVELESMEGDEASGPIEVYDISGKYLGTIGASQSGSPIVMSPSSGIIIKKQGSKTVKEIR